MEHDLERALAPLGREQQLIEELRDVNAISARFGLHLSEQGMAELAGARKKALIDHGRVEFGASALRNIADGFCDSPFLLQEDYEATLAELVDAFYYFKNACGDLLTDDELIAAMRKRYDAYDGSVEAVVGTSLEALCRARRLGQEVADDAWQEDEDDGE